MYQYIWDADTGGLLLTSEIARFSKEPRPVYYRELDILGFDKHWSYPKDDSAPLMWAESNNYIYRGRTVARVKGGSLYTAPELILLESPEPEGESLQFVDVEAMCRKNRVLMEALEQETIQAVYNTYREYKDNVDIFYVAFSGGKDSVVTLDIVQRALPHNEFMVLFGDTGMEFSDTYKTVEKVKEWCSKEDILFYTSKSDKTPEETWSQFGPPATTNRWCCSVHKTAPQIILLRKVLNKSDFRGLAFVGVRADESIARSKYEYISYEGKHRRQYSCNAILQWSSAEIFLYIFQQHLVLNEAYKKGNRRAGCLICPRAAERNDYMNHFCYYNEAEPLVNSIRWSYRNRFQTEAALEQFIKAGGWKARKNGRDISIPVNYREKTNQDGSVIITVDNPKTDWRVWIKTIGVVSHISSPIVLEYRGSLLHFELMEMSNGFVVIVDSQTSVDNPGFVKHLKNVFRKAACCVGCRECEADCPYGYLTFKEGLVQISGDCHHCAQCHKPDKGCLVYKSLEIPKGGIIMSGKSMSLNSYSHHAPRMDWMRQFFEYKNDFDEKNTLGSNMFSFFKRFLRDAQLIDATGFSSTATVIDNLGLSSEAAWGIIMVNLCYSPQVQWYVKRFDFDVDYSKAMLASFMVEDGAKESWTNDITNSLVRLSELPLGKVGIGIATREKRRIASIRRTPWENPVPEVILYSLYKFAEACGGIYQFTLHDLMDDTVERDGISPTRIFGLDELTMAHMLNGLSVNYPDFINASFTLDLDKITLRRDKTSADVLQLF